MGKTCRDLLVQALENLEEKSFKKFKNKLHEWEIKEGFNKISKSKLEKADAEDVTDLIRRYYKDSYGTEVTVAVLEAIDENREAEGLRNALQTVTGCAPQNPTKGADQGATSRDEEHFVDRHRCALIGRVTLVSPILDDLHQYRLLTAEQYDTVRSRTTSQEQMRELFSNVNSWGNEDKNKFLRSLRQHNSPLIRDLEGR